MINRKDRIQVALIAAVVTAVVVGLVLNFWQYAQRSEQVTEVSAYLDRVDWDVLDEPGYDLAWNPETSYRVRFAMPEVVFTETQQRFAVEVIYPTTVQAGEVFEISLKVEAEDGKIYTGSYTTAAMDDLEIVYGSSNPRVAIGEDLDYDDDYIGLWFYTSATPEHRAHRDGSGWFSSSNGFLSVKWQEAGV